MSAVCANATPVSVRRPRSTPPPACQSIEHRHDDARSGAPGPDRWGCRIVSAGGRSAGTSAHDIGIAGPRRHRSPCARHRTSQRMGMRGRSPSRAARHRHRHRTPNIDTGNAVETTGRDPPSPPHGSFGPGTSTRDRCDRPIQTYFNQRNSHFSCRCSQSLVDARHEQLTQRRPVGLSRSGSTCPGCGDGGSL
jgi:hypothetical protein